MSSEMKRLKMLDDENTRLERLIADLSIDKATLQNVIKRKRRGQPVAENWSMSLLPFGASVSGVPAACWAHRWTYHCKAHGSKQGELKKCIQEAMETSVRDFYWRTHVSLQREGWLVNAKRVYRLFTKLDLQLRNKNSETSGQR